MLAEARSFHPMWGIGLRADDPEARDPRRWREKILLRKALYSLLEATRTGEPGLATQASSQQFCTPTTTGGIHEISPAPPRPRALARACPGPHSEFSTCFSDVPADNSSEVLVIAPGVVPSLALSKHGPCLVGGIITLDDASFTTKIGSQRS